MALTRDAAKPVVKRRDVRRERAEGGKFMGVAFTNNTGLSVSGEYGRLMFGAVRGVSDTELMVEDQVEVVAHVNELRALFELGLRMVNAQLAKLGLLAAETQPAPLPEIPVASAFESTGDPVPAHHPEMEPQP